jgi:hypothetical protein
MNFSLHWRLQNLPHLMMIVVNKISPNNKIKSLPCSSRALDRHMIKWEGKSLTENKRRGREKRVLISGAVSFYLLESRRVPASALFRIKQKRKEAKWKSGWETAPSIIHIYSNVSLHFGRTKKWEREISRRCVFRLLLFFYPLWSDRISTSRTQQTRRAHVPPVLLPRYRHWLLMR